MRLLWPFTAAAATLSIAAPSMTSLASAGEGGVVATAPMPVEPPSDGADPASTASERERYRDGLLNPTLDVLAKLPGY